MVDSFYEFLGNTTLIEMENFDITKLTSSVQHLYEHFLSN